MTPTSPWYSKELSNSRGQYDRRNLGVGGLTPNDRHGSVQVVSSTNGDVAMDNPTVGLSDTLIAANPDVEVVSETKYVIILRESFSTLLLFCPCFSFPFNSLFSGSFLCLIQILTVCVLKFETNSLIHAKHSILSTFLFLCVISRTR